RPNTTATNPAVLITSVRFPKPNTIHGAAGLGAAGLRERLPTSRCGRARGARGNRDLPGTLSVQRSGPVTPGRHSQMNRGAHSNRYGHSQGELETKSPGGCRSFEFRWWHRRECQAAWAALESG